MKGHRYRAFISYSHRDREWGEWLHRALEAYVVPKRLVGQGTAMGWVPPRLTPVFRDLEELPSASDLGGKVGEALANSDNLIVICSPAAAASRWVDREILAFKQSGRADRIFCLIVDGEPNASERGVGADQECFPPALRFGLGSDGELDHDIKAEPIAADVRAHRDGRSIALLKLVAGLLGVGVDDLRQREQTRRHRRATLIASVAVVLATVMVVLGVQAILARQAAERRQKQAEALVGYMLGDLNKKLTEVNRLDIFEGVADEAMRYFEALPDDDISETGLDQRVSAMVRIGSVRLDQGDAQGARTAFEGARKLSARLAKRSPKDVSRQMAYADTLNWIGLVDWRQGQTDAAAKWFAAAHTVLASNREKAPASPQMLSSIKDVATNNGRILEAAGNFDEAESNYLDVLDVVRRLRKLQPENVEWLVELGYAYNNLGVLAARRGRLGQAARYYAEDLEIKQALSAASPRNDDLKGSVAVALMFSSKLRGQLGQTDRAIEEQRKAIELYGRLRDADPGNVSNSYYLGLAQRGLATLLLDAARSEEAVNVVIQARTTLQGAARDDPANPRKAMRALEARLLEARMARLRGDSDETLSIAAEVDKGLSTIQPGEADLAEQAQFRTLSKMLMADAVASVDPVAARRYRLAARELLAPQLTESTHDPDLLDPWLRIAAELDSKPFPERELKGLQVSGYANPSFIEAMRRARIDYRPVQVRASAT